MYNDTPLETWESIQLHTQLKAMGIPHAHIANEAKAKPQYMKKRADMGVSKGYPDFSLLVPTKTQGTLTIFIELKRKKRLLKNGTYTTSHTKTSPEQLEWIKRLNECEATEARVCYGAAEAIAYVKEIMEL